MSKEKEVKGKKWEDFDVATIDERAVLVYLGTGMFNASKLDKQITATVEASHGAEGGTMRVSKSLLPSSKELKEFKQTVTDFRQNVHYQKTTAFGRDGWALLPSVSLGDYKKLAITCKEKCEEIADRFAESYNQRKEEAKELLGSAFKETDYPPVEVVRSKFKFDTSTRRIRQSSNDLIGVSDDLRKEIMEEADNAAREGLRVGVEALAKRIGEVVGNVAEVLGREGEKAPKIYDSLIDNVKVLASELPLLNVTGDETFNKIADKMMKDLGTVRVEDLRGNDPAAVEKRKEVVESAEKIMSEMDVAF
jgi:hypothetical protein